MAPKRICATLDFYVANMSTKIPHNNYTAHTNTVETMWGHAKRQMGVNSRRKNLFLGYAAIYMLRNELRLAAAAGGLDSFEAFV